MIYKNVWIFWSISSVPIPIHINKPKIKCDLAPNLKESSVCFMIIFNHLSMSSITKRSISWIFTITEFIISTFWYIKLNWSTSCYHSITCSITTWITLWKSTWTPSIYFSLLKICIIWKPTFINLFLPVTIGILGGRYLPYM